MFLWFPCGYQFLELTVPYCVDFFNLSFLLFIIWTLVTNLMFKVLFFFFVCVCLRWILRKSLLFFFILLKSRFNLTLLTGVRHLEPIDACVSWFNQTNYASSYRDEKKYTCFDFVFVGFEQDCKRDLCCFFFFKTDHCEHWSYVYFKLGHWNVFETSTFCCDWRC